MIQQVEITLKPKSRGFHLVTGEILSQLPKLPKTGIVNIFCKHTSCGLSINENADPDVRVDMETIFNRLVPENRPEYEHTLEGADDMPAHAKSTLSGVSLTIPITDGHLNMGTWQGIYFCEYRNFGGSRRLVVTIMGEWVMEYKKIGETYYVRMDRGERNSYSTCNRKGNLISEIPRSPRFEAYSRAKRNYLSGDLRSGRNHRDCCIIAHCFGRDSHDHHHCQDHHLLHIVISYL